MGMKKLSLLSILMAFVLLTACGGNQGNTVSEAGEKGPDHVIRFVHEEQIDSVQQSYVEEFKKIIEEKSDGNVHVEIYPVGQLGDATTQAELLQIGAVDMAIVSPGNIGTMVPESQALLLHFLFSDDMQINKQVLNESEALYGPMNEAFLDRRIKVLSYWTEGFNHWTANTSFEQPSDFEGNRFRTMPSPLIVSSYEAYGANPTPMPYEQVYSGLQLNMIDGQTNPMFAIEQMKFYEVQSNMTLSRHSLYVTTTAINPDYYEGLPEDVQQMIDETVEEMKDKSFEIQNEQNSEDLETIKQESNIEINELTGDQREAFREASKSVREEYVEMVGNERAREIIDTLEKEIQELEGKN
ncbi:DctP family TRAP transporter solute-binding subunit [Allobacillus sp. SKP2-8]|nr:DctP family TRAP transporter solute-binding subunit [Allobacillus sp. SKP2-8]